MNSMVRSLAFGTTLVLMLVTAGMAQNPDPNSPRFLGVTRVRDMLKTTGTDELKKFVKDYVAESMVKQVGSARLLEALENTRTAYGKSMMVGARVSGPFSAALVFADTPKGLPESIEFTVQEAKPHRFTDMTLVANKVTGTKVGGPVPKTDDEMVKAIKDHLAQLVEEDEFSGAVLIAKNGETLFQQAYGLASKSYNVPNNLETKFNLGSMNKMFTGVAICQLAEQGKLSFDDTIAKHIPDYADKDIAEKVTIHHLLTHTSGLGTYWNDKYEEKWKTIRTVNDLAETFVGEPLAFEPGERFRYSNVGPVVLGMIIERITGQSYYDYVRENIYQPAGMVSTDCYENDRPTPNLATGYTRYNYDGTKSTGSRRNNFFMHSVKGGPAGGGFSTVGDMLRFSEALQSHKLLSKKFTDIMISGKTAMAPGVEYAYLFGDHKEEGNRYHGHNGGAPGINAEFSFYPERGYTVSIFSNYDMAASILARRVRSMIKGLPHSGTVN